MQEPEPALALKSWLRTNGGEFHPDAIYTKDASGYQIVAAKDIPAESHIVSCPSSLIITHEFSREAILNIMGYFSEKTSQWNERQWISTYISFHWIVGKHARLIHTDYLNTLPTPDKLRTPLHFSSSELDLFRGSNVYMATIEKERDWRNEWEQCRSAVADVNSAWAEHYTWEKYLNATTYLSTRAFPSSLISGIPTLVSDPSTSPILIPGVDSLNHAYARSVSWLVTNKNEEGNNDQELKITVVHHSPAVQGQELFSNYGPKPNAELVLGYGFSLPDNPYDTIVLKLGGIDGQKWEIGREAYNAEGLWREILSKFVQSDGGKATYEDILDAANALHELTEGLLQGLPQRDIPESAVVRSEVAEMFQNYIDGQRDILNSLLEFARERENDAVQMAREYGIELIVDDTYV